MDKVILDKLIKFGLITNINVDPEKYTDIDDLINKGIVTIPGAKSKIMELLENAGIESIEVKKDEIIEVKEDEIVEVTKVDEPESSADEIIDAVEVVEETVTDESPVEEVVEETVTEEAPVEEAPKKKKSTKKAEQAE